MGFRKLVAEASIELAKNVEEHMLETMDDIRHYMRHEEFYDMTVSIDHLSDLSEALKILKTGYYTDQLEILENFGYELTNKGGYSDVLYRQSRD